MKLKRAVRVLAGLGLVAALALASGGAVAQSATPADPSKPAKIGSSLIGKLEGPEIIRDAKAFPKTFKEAPMLAEQVKAGKLPAVDKAPARAFAAFRREAPERDRENTAATGDGPSPDRPTMRTATASIRPTRS